MEVWEKSQTVDPEVRAYVYSLVNAVGGSSTIDDTYNVGDDALAALHDLVRWLKLYDEKLRRDDVKRCIAEANLVKGDLVEIMALWPEEQTNNKLKAKQALACLQLIVPLTWPFDLDEDKFTVNNHRHLPYLQLAHVSYKRTLLGYEHAKILRTAVRVGLPHMAIPRRERTRRDEGVIKLVLYLCRNLAQITQPQHLPSQGDENDVSRSATIEAFNDQDVFALLLTIGSSAMDEFQEEDVVLLEILFHLLKGVDPNKIFMDKEQLNKHETNELQGLIQKEKAMLNGYNKTAPSRHHRFGTMVWVKRADEKMSTLSGQQSIADQSSTLDMMDCNKKWNKPKYRGKANGDVNENADFGRREELTEPARKTLNQFVGDVLDSSFNPLFASLRKAIASENERVSETHIRQYFYLIHWFLAAESARREQRKKQSTLVIDKDVQPQENVFAYIAAVLDQETFILLNRHTQRAYDDKEWQTLQATLLCFTQTLLTVQSMAESDDDEDQEIAENIQSRIFYEEATHDRIVQILRNYKNQGFGYLNTVTECVHVFTRLLEKYSKQNVDLMVRSKRRARTKKKKDASEVNGDGNANAEEEAEDTREAQTAVSERKFDFARFSAKFLSQGCVDTFIAFLQYYRELTPAQLKRCHRYLYRLAFKHELTVLLYRVDVLQLLNRMIKSSEGIDTHMEGYKDWYQLVQQILRRCIRWIERSSEGEGWKEIAVVEMLFSKVPNTLFYLQNGYERVVEHRAPRPPVELEFKAKVEAEKQIGVIVSILIDQTKSDAIAWIRSQLLNAVNERTAWEDEQTAREVISEPSETLNETEKPSAPSIFLVPDSKERTQQLFKDKFLRLLLSTIGCQRLGLAEDVDGQWIIPSELSSTHLQSCLDRLNKAEFDPPSFEEGQSALDMVRNKVLRTSREDEDDDGASSGGEINETLFPPNLRQSNSNDNSAQPKRRRLTRRVGKELTEEELKERAEERKRKEKERNSKIKSQLYITAADDESDEEADAEFFRLEEQRRRKTAGEIGKALKRVAEADSDEQSEHDASDSESGSENLDRQRQKGNSKKTGPATAKRKSPETSISKRADTRKRQKRFDSSSDNDNEDMSEDMSDDNMSDQVLNPYDSEKEDDVDRSRQSSLSGSQSPRNRSPLRRSAHIDVEDDLGKENTRPDEDGKVSSMGKKMGRTERRPAFILEDSDDE